MQALKERLLSLNPVDLREIEEYINAIKEERITQATINAVTMASVQTGWELQKSAIDLFIVKHPGESVIDVIEYEGKIFIILSEKGEWQVNLNDGSIVFLQQVYQMK